MQDEMELSDPPEVETRWNLGVPVSCGYSTMVRYMYIYIYITLSLSLSIYLSIYYLFIYLFMYSWGYILTYSGENP